MHAPKWSITEKIRPLRRMTFEFEIDFNNVIQSLLLSVSSLPIESTLRLKNDIKNESLSKILMDEWMDGWDEWMGWDGIGYHRYSKSTFGCL